MSRTGWKSLVATTALFGVVAVVSNGCGSDNSNGSDAMADAAEEATHPVHRDTGAQSDTATTTTGDSAVAFDSTTVGDGASGPFDGTTGKPCTMDSQCVGAGGAGLNICSIANYFVNGPLNPTPVCVSPVPCDLGDGSGILFCDSADPNDLNSPGICLPSSTAMTGMNGHCMPKCTIPADGSAPTGCQGKNRCNLFAMVTDVATGAISALGFCLGGCTANSDCPTGSSCQIDEGLCMTKPQTPTKQLGQTCTTNDQTTTNYHCNCFYQSMTMLGYCSQFCITGPSSPAPCPSGYVCDPQLSTQIPGQDGGMVATGYTKVNPGLSGFCLQACSTASVDAGGGATDAMVGDAASDAATAPPADAQASTMCPVTANCSMQYTAGPDCVP